MSLIDSLELQKNIGMKNTEEEGIEKNNNVRTSYILNSYFNIYF